MEGAVKHQHLVMDFMHFVVFQDGSSFGHVGHAYEAVTFRHAFPALGGGRVPYDDAICHRPESAEIFHHIRLCGFLLVQPAEPDLA